MSDRRLYDLCRKYKYFYRKYTSLKKVNDEFYDKDVKNAYVKVKTDLDEIRRELVAEILYPYLWDAEITCETQHDNISSWGSRMLVNPFQRIEYTTTIRGKGFADFVSQIQRYSRHHLR